MNVVIAYLDTMFGAYPQTPRLLEAKAELRGMMEDAYTSLIAEGRSENEAVGQVIRDFGNLEELAPVLGITADLAPAGAATGADRANPAAARIQHPPVTMEEARGYADVQRRCRFRLGTAVSLFVLSPVALIILPTAVQTGAIGLDQGVASALGILLLLVLIAVGVMLVMSISRDAAPFKRLEEGRFSPDPAVTRWAESLAQQHEPARVRALQIAVAFWILSPAPLIALSLLTQGAHLSGLWSVIGVGLVLGFVATGLAILLPAAWANGVAEKLGRGAAGAGRGSHHGDEQRSVVGVIAAFYWPLLTAIYLAWSFIGDAWGSSWIVWPVGAVLFGAIAAGGGALESYRRSRQ